METSETVGAAPGYGGATVQGPGRTEANDFGDAGALLASIMTSSADAIVGQRLDGVVTVWNAGAEQMYGWKAEEMLGTSVRRIIPSDLHQEIEFLLSRVRQGERVMELLTRRIRSDGKHIDVSLTVSPIRDSTGRVAGICTIERDVTERRRIEAIVKGQQRMLETLTRTGRLADGLRELLDSMEGLAAGDLAPGVLIADEERRILTPSTCRLPARLLQALRKGILVAPHGHPAGQAAFKRQAVSVHDLTEVTGFEELQRAAIESGFLSCFSIPLLSPDGQLRGTLDLYGESKGPPRPDDLEVACALGQTAALAIDRFESVRQVQRGREVLSALNEFNALLLADFDVEPIIKRAIEEATRLVGAQMGAFLCDESESGVPAFRPHGLAGEKAELFSTLALPCESPLLSQTSSITTVQRLDDVGEDPRYVSYSGVSPPVGLQDLRSFMSAPVSTRSGETLGILVFGHGDPRRFSRWHEEILRGIASQTALALDNARLLHQATDRAAELGEADRRKDEFLAMVGHELRGPLSAMTSSLALLHESPPRDDDASQAMHILRRQATNMKRLVNDLLEVSRISRGKILLKRETMDASEVVRQTVHSMRCEAAERGQAIEMVLPARPAWIRADPVRFEQVVSNLLLNALKFSPPRAFVRVVLSLRDRDVRLTVRDEGSGIPEDQLQVIFDMFVQGDDRETHGSRSGLGLGLTLVRELVQAHGGSVTARSDGKGRGSEFEVTLPTCAPPASRPGRSDAPGRKPRFAPVLRLLVVEDDPDGAEALTLLLRKWGHRVEHVPEGQVAIELARRKHPDAALLDIGLPGMDGWEIARKLRSIPELSDVRLVALTGRSRVTDMRRSRDAGFDRHFVKPVEPAELEVWLDALAGTIDA